LNIANYTCIGSMGMLCESVSVKLLWRR